jgi:hypothetical protein
MDRSFLIYVVATILGSVIYIVHAVCTSASQKLSALQLHIVQLVTLLVGHDVIHVVYLSPTAVVKM